MFRLRTLGGISLERDGRPLEGRATQRRRLALLAYLAAADERPVRRDKIVALLWPERDEERGRHSLSQLLSALRRDLGEAAIMAGVDELRLDPAIVRSDVRELRAALKRGDPERAVSIYAGPFLDGFFIDGAPEFDRWVEAERSELAAAMAEALEALATRAATAGDHAVAARWWRRRAALDPLDARVTLSLMEALSAAGDRAAAIRHARVHAELLRAELDAEPDPAVEGFAGQLRLAPPPGGPEPVAVGASATPAVEPAGRSADALGSGLRPRRGSGTRKSSLVLAVAAAGLAVGLVLPRFLSHAPAAPRVAVLGELAGADSVMAMAVREALRAELAGDGGIRLVDEFRIREVLALMQLPPTTRLTPPVVLDVAERHGAQYAITGSVAPLAGGLQLVIQVVPSRARSPVVTVSARPERADQVIAEVGRVARKLRAKLSRLPVDSAARPLPAVTTASLEALEQYALARVALARGDRPAALALGEGALAHDSLFPLAHYLVGDLLWWADEQRHAETHLTRARALADLAPIRERLLVGARYYQLVADRPDSALANYLQLRSAYPNEVLAYEGMAWTLRALGQHRAAAAAADTAYQLDPSAGVPAINNRLYALISVGDTAAALAVTGALAARDPRPYHEARYLTALIRRDWPGALAVLDSTLQGLPADDAARRRDYRRHAPTLALGRLEEARAMIPELARIVPPRQFAVRALILQAIAESAAGDTGGARRLAWEAKAWVDRADLSAAALARLHERVAILGAWLRDHRLVTAEGAALRLLDAGRGLRSYSLALRTVAGARAALEGRPAEAAWHLAASREETFHGRSTSTVALFEADVAMLAGDRGRAAELYRAVERFRIPDPDFETWPVLSALATRRLAGLDRSNRATGGSQAGRAADALPYRLGAGGMVGRGSPPGSKARRCKGVHSGCSFSWERDLPSLRSVNAQGMAFGFQPVASRSRGLHAASPPGGVRRLHRAGGAAGPAAGLL